MTAKLRIMLALMALLLSVLPATAQEGTRSLTMVLSRDPVSLDPHGPLDPSGPVLLAYVYDTLLYQNARGEIEPFLAASWSVSEDGRAVTFELRDDVVFSNGEPLTADAVIFTFQRLQERGQRSLIYSEIANITEFEKLSDSSVRFHLAEPSATLLSALTYTYAAILEPGAVEAAGEDYGSQPVGSGPFMLAEWIPDNRLTLVPNPRYNGHRPVDETPGPVAVDALHVRFTTDESTRVNALLSGEVDIAYISSAPLLEPVEDNPDFRILDNPARGVVFAGFNCARPPFQDVNLRHAVAYAVNKQEILDIARDGLGVVINTPLPPSIFGYSPELEEEALTYDPDAARELLAAAGYGPDNPLEITILTSTFPTYDAMATVMQAQLAEVGINATIEVLDFGGLAAAASAGEYDIVITRFDWNDPDLLRVYLGSGSSGNRYGYASPELDALVAEGRQTFDPERRFEIYTQAQRVVMQDLPLLPLHMPITKVVVNNRVQDVALIHSHVSLENASIVE